MRPSIPSTLLLTLALTACADAGGAAGDPAWRLDSVWDDGRAEYCAYTVEWPRYGRIYDGTALLVTVKEPWAPDLEVKADRPRPDGFEVLKLNHIRDVGTGAYTYRQMASLFLRRDSGAVRKLAASSAEACGLSTAWLLDGSLETRSYFDGEGESRRPVPPGVLPEDGLPALLREYVAGEPPASVTVLPTVLTGRFGDLTPVAMDLRRSGPAAVATSTGPVPAIEVSLEGEGRRLVYSFDARPPHRLLRFAASDGTLYEVAKCERIPYWRMNAPEDRDWLPEALR